MSFLDAQDLATVAAQVDIAWLISAWCCESDTLLAAVEASLGACLVAFVTIRKAKR